MANTDFTLQDIRDALKSDIRSIVEESIDARFTVFEKKYDNDMAAIQQDFLAIYARFDRLEGRMDSLEREVKLTNRIVKQHSHDIMQLRAASA